MTKERIKRFLEYAKPEKIYNNFLKDKRVAIVGPSKHILLHKNGSNIDNYDVVIRLKWLPIKGANTYKDFIGDETHIMYSSVVNLESDYDILSRSGIKYTRHPKCDNGNDSSTNIYNGINATSYSTEEYAIILKEYADKCGWFQNKIDSLNSKSKYGIWPQLGFNAIIESIASDAKEIYITGFTMYHGGGHMLQKNKPAHHNKTIVEKHNGAIEILLLNDIIKHLNDTNKTVTTDSVLNKILHEYNGVQRKVESLTPVINNLTNEINNLVKDL